MCCSSGLARSSALEFLSVRRGNRDASLVVLELGRLDLADRHLVFDGVFVEEVDDVVVHIEFAIRILGGDRLARVYANDQLECFARSDISHHPFLGAHERRSQGQVPIILKLGLAQIEP